VAYKAKSIAMIGKAKQCGAAAAVNAIAIPRAIRVLAEP
jgi:hypothetical protein